MSEGATNQKIPKGILTVKGDFWINYKLYFLFIDRSRDLFYRKYGKKSLELTNGSIHLIVNDNDYEAG